MILLIVAGVATVPVHGSVGGPSAGRAPSGPLDEYEPMVAPATTRRRAHVRARRLPVADLVRSRTWRPGRRTDPFRCPRGAVLCCDAQPKWIAKLRGSGGLGGRAAETRRWIVRADLHRSAVQHREKP